MRRQNGANQRLDRLEIPPSRAPPKLLLSLLWRIPRGAPTGSVITAPSKIKYYLLLRNRLHFRQAQGTLFPVPPFATNIDWAATSSFSNKILNGTYGSQVDVPQCQACRLAACQAATNLDLLPAELDLKDFTGKIQAWEESTTTSPSGRHLGTYKALLSPSTHNPDSDEFKVFPESNQRLYNFFSS